MTDRETGFTTAVAIEEQEATETFGVLAAFVTPDELIKAVRRVRELGYTKFDTHTPFAVHGLESAMGMGRSRLPLIVLGGAATGFTAAILLQWWTGAVDYPLMIGGKPFFALEFATPVAFELTVLFAAFAAVFGMFALNGLPRLYHPVFNTPEFSRASNDRFFLSIEATDSLFEEAKTVELLESLGAKSVEVVEK